MPSKNRTKVYFKGAFYHIYNRGVAKQEIFMDDTDYKVFLRCIKQALSPPPEIADIEKRQVNVQGRTFSVPVRQPKNFEESVNLLAFCLMPNHFHLFIKQLDDMSMKDFMQSISTRYSMYFNKRYGRVGPLFQGRYKAVVITNEAQMVYLSKYIHLNPKDVGKDLKNWYSSYSDYLGLTNKPWLRRDVILDLFSSGNFKKKSTNYKTFVEEEKTDEGLLKGKKIDDR